MVQGFENRPGGARDRGAGCLEATSDTVAFAALPEATRTPAYLADRITASASEGADPNQIPALIIAARSMLARTFLDSKDHAGDVLPVEARSAIVEAMVGAYPRWPASARAMAVASMPPARQVAALAPLEALAMSDTDPTVRAVVIVSRTDKPEDPVIAAAIASGDAALAQLAASHQERLAASSRAFVESGFGRIFPSNP